MDPINRRLVDPSMIQAEQPSSETIQQPENSDALMQTQDSIERYDSEPLSLSQLEGYDVYSQFEPNATLTERDARLQELQNKLSDLEAKKEDLLAQMVELKKQIAALAMELADAEDSGIPLPIGGFKIGGTDTDEIEQRLAAAQHQFDSLQSDLAKLNSDIEELTNEIDEMDKRNMSDEQPFEENLRKDVFE